MPNLQQESSTESKIGENLPFNESYNVLHIDIVPSRFLITPEIDNLMRKIAINFVDFIKTKRGNDQVAVTYPQYCSKPEFSDRYVQIFKNPQIWKCYPKFNIHENYLPKFGEMSAYALSWDSIHTITAQFLTLKSCIASVPSLSMGLCPDEDQNFFRNLSPIKPSNILYDLRLAIPTFEPGVEYLLATPPSLSWALVVALEFFRLQAIDGETRDCETSNLTTNTVGVLENWIDFMLYGSLIDSEDERASHLSENWIRSTSKSSQSNSSFPAILTLIIDCSDLIPSSEFVTENLDEQLIQLNKAWQDAVYTSVQRTGSASVISPKKLEDINGLQSVFEEIDIVCRKRFFHSKHHRSNIEEIELGVSSA